MFGGLPTDEDSEWREFWSEYDRVLGPQIVAFDRGCGPTGPVASDRRDYMWESPFLNLYLYPKAADYRRKTASRQRGIDSTRACDRTSRST